MASALITLALAIEMPLVNSAGRHRGARRSARCGSWLADRVDRRPEPSVAPVPGVRKYASADSAGITSRRWTLATFP